LKVGGTQVIEAQGQFDATGSHECSVISPNGL